MVLYHGSKDTVEHPVFGKGKPYNDYGQGFYCTEDPDLASEWAVDKDRDGYVNAYRLDARGLKTLDLNSDGHTVLHWVSLLVFNRTFDLDTPLSREAFRYLQSHFRIDTTGYDLIRGYRADDSYFSYAQDFLNGAISVSQLSNALRLGNLGEQVMINSQRSFDRLSFTGASYVTASEWYERKRERDSLARAGYRSMNRSDYIPGELYMIRIIDEEVGPDDPRIR
ncbi:MAG: DUF3990 domain-containing protein [Lachnospiraceae bacterium]|nr:DUF3990 domain-containing protein [Lachnospiraceae bacterium]